MTYRRRILVALLLTTTLLITFRALALEPQTIPTKEVLTKTIIDNTVKTPINPAPKTDQKLDTSQVPKTPTPPTVQSVQQPQPTTSNPVLQPKQSILTTQAIDDKKNPTTTSCNLGRLENDNIYNIVKLNPNCITYVDPNGNDTVQSITFSQIPPKANGYLVYQGFRITEGQSLTIKDIDKIGLITTKECDRNNEFYYTVTDVTGLKGIVPSKIEWKCGPNSYDNDLKLIKYTVGEFQEYRKGEYRFRIVNDSNNNWKGQITLTDLMPQRFKIIWLRVPTGFECTGIQARDLKCVSTNDYQLIPNQDVIIEAEVWVDTESNGLVRNQGCITTLLANENPVNNCSYVETFVKPVDLADLPKDTSKTQPQPLPEPKPQPQPLPTPEPTPLPTVPTPIAKPLPMPVILPILEDSSALPRTGGVLIMGSVLLSLLVILLLLAIKAKRSLEY
jgi:hypothetical protein